MIDTACHLCGSKLRTVLFKQQGRDPYFEIVFGPWVEAELDWCVCDRCGFVYRSPVLDDAETARLYENYEEDVFRNRDPDEYFNRIVGLPDEESENVQKTAWLGEVLPKRAGKDTADLSVLDVGCGTGTLLHTMREKLGLGRMCAVELNPAYAELAARRLEADIRNRAYEAGLFKKKFDLVVCTKVLEHVADAKGFVELLGRDTADGGFLFIEVPDVSEIWRLPPDHDRFYVPHLYFFSETTMTALMAQAGLEAVESRTAVTHRGRAYLQVVVRKSGEVGEPAMPYDDPERLADRVARLQPRPSGGGDA